MMNDEPNHDDEPFEEEAPLPIPHQYDREAILEMALPVMDELKIPSSALRMVLDSARFDAIAALKGLIRTEASNVQEVRRLQWQVTRFEVLCTYVAEILMAGKEATEDSTGDQASALEKIIRGDNGEPKD